MLLVLEIPAKLSKDLTSDRLIALITHARLSVIAKFACDRLPFPTEKTSHPAAMERRILLSIEIEAGKKLDFLVGLLGGSDMQSFLGPSNM